MPRLDLRSKLSILADAAKYDASCASSGAGKRKAKDAAGKPQGLGSTTGMGICHSYTPDGRCVSLLKILMTNVCIFDCAYCINRSSSNVQRAAFTVDEVVDLTIEFYKRNYIEGLFLSSGIMRSSDWTMERLVEVARRLRDDHDFRGYIHLKTIPDADPKLLEAAGRYADRLSINVELPTEAGLKTHAPEKNHVRIEAGMAEMKTRIEAGRDATRRYKSAPRWSAAGQSTQMIVGADDASDATILAKSSGLYAAHGLKRVYFSAFSPIPDASSTLPAAAPPLIREHRLYQADWLMRFYGFAAGELAETFKDGMLDLSRDPKLAWASANRALFPVDVNAAPRETLLRVPGLGVKVVDRIIAARRHGRLRLLDLGRLTRAVERIKPFVVAADWRPVLLADAETVVPPPRPARRAPPAQQLDLFAA